MPEVVKVARRLRWAIALVTWLCVVPGHAQPKSSSSEVTKERLQRQLRNAERELGTLREEIAKLPGANQGTQVNVIGVAGLLDGGVATETLRDGEMPDGGVVGETEVPDPDPKKQLREATLAKEKALAEAERTDDQKKRQAAEERARLLGAQEAMARYTQQLAKKIEDNHVQAERRLAIAASADTLAKRSILEGDKTQEAVALHREVVTALNDARPDLADALNAVQPGADVGIPVFDAKLRVETEDLLALRDDVRATAQELRRRHLDVSWDAIDEIVASMDELGRVRETVFKLLPREIQARRFSNDEAANEVQQIVLDGKHSALSIPRRVRAWITNLTTSPLSMIGLLGMLFRLAILFFVFLSWQRIAGGLLADQQKDESTGPFASLFWYVRRVRRPLEWWLLIEMVLWITDLRGFPGVNYVRVAAAWIFGGWAAILLVDAVAAWRHRRIGYRSKTEQLRLRSLKMVGWTTIVLGLLLSLTSESVGRGAIYGWVVRLCLILIVPVVLTLILWWQSTIFRIVDAHEEPSALIKWVQANKNGWKRFGAAAVGGVYLFGWGAFRWVLGWASRSDMTQRFRAYLFRKQVAKKAEETGDALSRKPIPEELYAKFDPAAPTRNPIESIARTELDALEAQINMERTSLSALVGERGAGKSMFLTRLVRRVGDRVRIVDCPETYDALLGVIATTLGVATTEGAIKEALRRNDEPLVVCLDNVQRLIRPAIGGLDGLDALTNFARGVGGNISWVIAIELPAWQYFRRARSGRVFFDYIAVLPKWTELQIGELVRRRSEHARLEPSFEGLVVPRQIDAPPDEDPDAHREDGYYRVLWDFSDGNPAVALHFWRESLYASDEGGAPTVHLFREPAADRIEQLPPAMHYVLRAIVQLDLATLEDIVTCTNLPGTDVADALRLAFSRGFVEESGQRIRIAWPWYRTLTDFLRRQHLLVATQ